MIRPPPRSTLFPYTTHFRSAHAEDEARVVLLAPGRRRVVVTPLHAEVGEEALVDRGADSGDDVRSEEHTSELQSLRHLVCRLLLEQKNTREQQTYQLSMDHT